MANLKNQKGIALPVVLVVMLLLLALGVAAVMMSNLGYTSLSSETRYQYAEKAAESGIDEAVSRIIPTAQCSYIGSGSVGNASYSYFSFNDADNLNCFVYSTGTFGNAKVVKTAVVLRTGSQWTALRTMGGTINLAGSSAIAGCDDDESAYADRCGVISAVIYSGDLNYKESDVSSPLINCIGEGSLKGYEGNPPLQRVDPRDLVSTYFNVTDQNGNGTAFDELMTRIENQKGIEFYPDLPTTPTIGGADVPDACKYTEDKACSTISNVEIKCGTEKNINLNICDTVYIKTPLTINHNINNINKEIRVANTVNINVSGGANNLNIKSNNTVTISSALSDSNIQANSVQLNAALSNSTIISGGNIDFSTSDNFNVQNSKLVSGGTINVGTTGNERFRGSISYSDFFANALNFNLTNQPDDKIVGGIFYAKNGGVTINTQGALNFGTITNPVLLLSEGTAAISMPGNFTFNGFIYTNAVTINITGAVELQGMIVSASNNATINNTGNGIIQFQKRVLDYLYENLKTAFGGTPLLNRPQCGAGKKKDYLLNTKITVY